MGRLVRGSGHLVPAESWEPRRQAATLLAAARAEADALRTAAAAVQEEARRRGYEEGRDAAAAQLSGLLLAASAEATRALEEAGPAAITLASRIAAKIVGHAIETSPGVMAELVGEALTAARGRPGRVLLRVHPTDRAALEAERPALLNRLAAGAQLALVDDPSVERYGCVVETAVGRVDARLATQLAVFERVLLGGRGRG